MSKFSELLNSIDEVKDKLNDNQYKEIMDKLMKLKNEEKDDEIYYKLEYEEIVITPFAYTDEEGEIIYETNETQTFKKQFIKVVDVVFIGDEFRNKGWDGHIVKMIETGEIGSNVCINNYFLKKIKEHSITKKFYTSTIIYRINKFERIK